MLSNSKDRGNWNQAVRMWTSNNSVNRQLGIERLTEFAIPTAERMLAANGYPQVYLEKLLLNAFDRAEGLVEQRLGSLPARGFNLLLGVGLASGSSLGRDFLRQQNAVDAQEQFLLQLVSHAERKSGIPYGRLNVLREHGIGKVSFESIAEKGNFEVVRADQARALYLLGFDDLRAHFIEQPFLWDKYAEMLKTKDFLQEDNLSPLSSAQRPQVALVLDSLGQPEISKPDLLSSRKRISRSDFVQGVLIINETVSHKDGNYEMWTEMMSSFS